MRGKEMVNRYRHALHTARFGERDLTIAVGAKVTAHHIAVFDPARVVLPEGQLVVPRDPGHYTRFPWLTEELAGETASYHVHAGLGPPPTTRKPDTSRHPLQSRPMIARSRIASG